SLHVDDTVECGYAYKCASVLLARNHCRQRAVGELSPKSSIDEFSYRIAEGALRQGTRCETREDARSVRPVCRQLGSRRRESPAGWEDSNVKRGMALRLDSWRGGGPGRMDGPDARTARRGCAADRVRDDAAVLRPQ